MQRCLEVSGGGPVGQGLRCRIPAHFDALLLAMQLVGRSI